MPPNIEAGFDILDAWILAENKVVTYKLLSRLLRCHVNFAKQTLAAWREKNPNSHATYVLCGTSNATISQDIEPPQQQSSMETEKDDDASTQKLNIEPHLTLVHNIRLVAEEDLEMMKAKYQSITSCHVYSVEPARLRDYAIVIDVRNDVKEAMRGQSTKIIDLASTFGTTFNAGVHEADQKRVTRHTQVQEMKPIMKVEPKAEPVAKPQSISRESSTTSQNKQIPEKSVMVPKLKRSAASSLASAFAKTQKPKPKIKADPDNLEVRAQSPEKKMKEEATNDPQPQKAVDRPPMKTKKQMEEEANLRDMMMLDDDEEKEEEAKVAVIPAAGPAVEETVEADMLDGSDWSASDIEMTETKVAPAPVVVPEVVKKRTRKKVKKQVHTKDAKGYMVTKEEWEWVSCDEEEVAPVSKLSRQASVKSETTKTVTAAKKKAPGQGGIASYFSKR